MFKVKYPSGKYSRLVGTGKTKEQAMANLKSKKLQKQKSDLLNSLSMQELESLFGTLECSICNEEEFEDYCAADSTWGFKTYKDVENLATKLLSIIRVIQKIEGDKND